MTTLELIKRLADALDEWGHESGSAVCAENSELLAQARAFLDGAVEVPVLECRTATHFGNTDPKFIYLAQGAPSGEFALLSTHVMDAEAEALRGVPTGPVTVTIIVRPKGAG